MRAAGAGAGTAGAGMRAAGVGTGIAGAGTGTAETGMRAVVLQRQQIYRGSLILVNGEHEYVENTAGFDPIVMDYLVPVQARQKEQSPVLLRRSAAALLSKLMEELRGWKNIAPVSGWRSLEEQQEIWTASLRDNGEEFTRKYVAIPGHSEHQTGLAIDLGLRQEKIDFIRPDFPYTGICQAFRKKAAAYGFIQRYPADREAVTGIGHEPWHFRYVGVPHAEVMSENNMTLEEYVDFIREFPYGRNPYKLETGGQTIHISYLKAEEGCTRAEMDETVPCCISGNNIDGFIITEWRGEHGRTKKLWGN